MEKADTIGTLNGFKEFHGEKVKDLIDYMKFESLNNESSYYLRIITEDIPGVLSKITSIFTDFQISIKKILQLPESSKPEKPIPIIISTHKVRRNK